MIVAALFGSSGSVDAVSVAEVGTTYKPTVFSTQFQVYDHQDIASEPLGLATVTFSGVQAGSEIRVYSADMTELAGVENCAANQALSWAAFGPGSPNNTVYITIIKRGQRWMRFNYTSSVGAKEIPIFQQPDLAYSNPA